MRSFFLVCVNNKICFTRLGVKKKVEANNYINVYLTQVMLLPSLI